VVQTDKFTIVDTSGNIPTVPFEVSGGVVYIKEAVIKEVTAGKITAGTVTATVEMTAATITAGKIRSSALTDFATTTGFYLGIDTGTPKFRIGDPAGSRLSWDGSTLTVVSSSATITGGSVTLGSGNSRVLIDSNGLQIGVSTSGSYITLRQNTGNTGASLYLFNSSGVLSGSLLTSATGVTTFDGGSQINGSAVQDFNYLSGAFVQAQSTSNVDTIDSPLYSAGSLYVAGKAKIVGVATFSTTVNISGVLGALSNVDVSGYLAVDGVTYGNSGSASGVAFAPRQDDVNSGMYSDEADKVKFAAGGSECFRIVNASGTTYAIVSSGAIFRFGNTNTPITTESLASYITVQGSDGSTYKLAIVT
jgi:hypothetical protein